MTTTTAPPAHIRTVEALREHLQAAIELEHATIPPYLCAMYSIQPGANVQAVEIIRTVVVQEMLHMVLAANVLNAIGGAPVVDSPAFVPSYPCELPVSDHGRPLKVHLQRFSREAVAAFLKIEHPQKLPPRPRALAAARPGQLKDMIRRGELYGSIAEMYQAIEQALRYFDQHPESGGVSLFSGDPARQVSPEYYYASGGMCQPVHDLDSALAALRVIVYEGEGYAGTTSDGDVELFHEPAEVAHYYRFNEIHLGRHYAATDTPNSGPTGVPLVVDWQATYPMIMDPRTSAYPQDSEVRRRSEEFNQAYTRLLRLVHRAFNGEPAELIPGVVHMFDLRARAVALLRNPIPGSEHQHAGPSFEYVVE